MEEEDRQERWLADEEDDFPQGRRRPVKRRKAIGDEDRHGRNTPRGRRHQHGRPRPARKTKNRQDDDGPGR